MINNDSIITAYDEHLTLVEWLQKVEVLLKNGGLKETTLNDKGNATFSLTLTFNDGTKLESNAMALTSVNEALNNLNGDINTAMRRIDDLEDETESAQMYHGFDLHQTFNKNNSVRIGTEFSTEEWTLKRADTEIELSDEEASTAKQVLLKAIKYGFIAYADDSKNSYGALVNAAAAADTSIYTVFVLSIDSFILSGFLGVYIHLENGKWKYRCSND